MAAAAAVTFSGKVPFLASNFGRAGSSNVSRGWLSGALALPAAGWAINIASPFSVVCI